MIEVQVLKNAGWNAGIAECLLKALGAQQGLFRVLEHHGIASHQCRDDGIDCGQIGIIPGCYNKNNPKRFTLNPTFKTRFFIQFDWGQSLI